MVYNDIIMLFRYYGLIRHSGTVKLQYDRCSRGILQCLNCNINRRLNYSDLQFGVALTLATEYVLVLYRSYNKIGLR